MTLSISETEYDRILELKALGWPQGKIATEMGRGQSTISRVVLGRIGRPGTCKVCGRPVAPGNKVGICHNTPECDQAAHAAAYMRSVAGIDRPKCSVCGGAVKANTKYGICKRNPECLRRLDAARWVANPQRKVAQSMRRARPDAWSLDRIHYLRSHDLPTDLDVPYLLERWGTGRCPPCETEYSQGTKGGRATSPSMDRVYPERGYFKGNVRIICMRCNRRKQDLSSAEMFALALDTQRAEEWADNWVPGATPVLTASA